MYVWAYYILIYSVIRVSVIVFLNLNQIFHLKQVFLLRGVERKILFFMCFLSLGGLPPFLGFFPKMMVVARMVSKDYEV